jgi:hypothetical protein
MEYFEEEHWAEWMNEELNRLRLRLDDAAPPCADISAAWQEIERKSSAVAPLIVELAHGCRAR